jgi:hypothetical protein
MVSTPENAKINSKTSAKVTPVAIETAARVPCSMLFLSNEKKTGPNVKQNAAPTGKPAKKELTEKYPKSRKN